MGGMDGMATYSMCTKINSDLAEEIHRVSRDFTSEIQRMVTIMTEQRFLPDQMSARRSYWDTKMERQTRVSSMGQSQTTAVTPI